MPHPLAALAVPSVHLLARRPLTLDIVELVLFPLVRGRVDLIVFIHPVPSGISFHLAQAPTHTSSGARYLPAPLYSA